MARWIGHTGVGPLDEVVVCVCGLAEGGDHAVGVWQDGGVREGKQGAHLAAHGDDEVCEGGEEGGGVAVCGEDDGGRGDGAAGGVQGVRGRVLGGDDLRDGGGGLEVQTSPFDERLEDEGDELVGPEAAGAGGQGCAEAGGIDAVFCELGFVGDDLEGGGDFWGDGLEVGDLREGFVEDLLCPELAAAGDVAPFAGDVVRLDVGADGGDVLELEVGDVGAAVEEEGLAVAAVLECVSVVVRRLHGRLEGLCAMILIEMEFTLPVAPQHASRASSMTIFLPCARSSSER